MAQIKTGAKKGGQWDRALGKSNRPKSRCEKHFGAASQLALANSRPLQMRKTAGLLFFCFRSEGFNRDRVSGSSPKAQPFCSGLLKPNTGKDSPAPCLGGGAGFSPKWVLRQGCWLVARSASFLQPLVCDFLIFGRLRVFGSSQSRTMGPSCVICHLCHCGSRS